MMTPHTCNGGHTYMANDDRDKRDYKVRVVEALTEIKALLGRENHPPEIMDAIGELVKEKRLTPQQGIDTAFFYAMTQPFGSQPRDEPEGVTV